MKLENYNDFSGGGGITGYKFLHDGIILKFKSGDVYLYDDRKPGKEHVEQMKTLAKQGRGLTTYINQNVRENFKEKLN
jgi:hypothetical protein